jgi:hypothetical protein
VARRSFLLCRNNAAVAEYQQHQFWKFSQLPVSTSCACSTFTRILYSPPASPIACQLVFNNHSNFFRRVSTSRRAHSSPLNSASIKPSFPFVPLVSSNLDRRLIGMIFSLFHCRGVSYPARPELWLQQSYTTDFCQSPFHRAPE